MTYSEGVLYCQFLAHNGHKDWRMLTWEEYVRETDLAGSWLRGYPVHCWYAGADELRTVVHDEKRYIRPTRNL